MKRILVIVLMVLAGSMHLRAQQLELGIKGGLGGSDIRFTNLPDTLPDLDHPLVSYSINASLYYKSKGWWGLSVEPGIITKGYRGENGDSKIRLGYLQLLVLSDFYLTPKWYVSIGPEMNYILKANYKYGKINADISDVYNNTEVAGVGGITYKLRNNIDLGIRYGHGLKASNIVYRPGNINGDVNNRFVKMKEYNQYLQLTVRVGIFNLLK